MWFLTNSHGDFKPQDGHLLRPRMEVPHLTTMQMSTLIGVDQHTLRLHQQKEMVLKFRNQTCWFHVITSTQLKIKSAEFLIPGNKLGITALGMGSFSV